MEKVGLASLSLTRYAPTRGHEMGVGILPEMISYTGISMRNRER